ncbi:MULTISPECIES: AbrB/MazE/SpoVT family DNA-binding domain-containing protein [Brevibacillus]|uniref:AbrB/MazE/SpoVT family DNA-binding domain-containing protein n=1 Tax=Brevibacillus brevis TaxID=1393 RepID=A0ABY9TCT4_BREBE|nr:MULTISPECIES: AbrB/MazE/SpoVT family DNA-binding domain-containing protein [Brevibacillus]MBG9568453.1 hypothetical protein [Brevibacillus agri]WNC17915.1 AbrB/MazE/SpoVT family DNA-binding domain-containing protein [Brevibacillus brevis]
MIQKPLYSPVSSKGQTVIPAALRKKLNIQKGSVLHFELLSNNTFVVRVIREGESLSNISPVHKTSKIPAIGLKKTF